MGHDFSERPLHTQPFSVVFDHAVHIVGDVDVASAGLLLEAILVHAGAMDEPSVTIDLEGMTFLDSTGINAFVEANNRLQTMGKALRLDNVAPNIKELFVLTGVGGLLDVRPTNA